MDRFTSDNTEGYGQDDLDLLNTEFAFRTYNLDRDPDGRDAPLLDFIAERMLADFDDGVLGVWPSNPAPVPAEWR